MQHNASTRIAGLEVSIAGPEDAPLICAAHPASVFGPPTAELLAQHSGGRVLAVNPRGLGGSTPGGPGYDLTAMVDDLEQVRHQLGLGRWLFWGMSGGGWLGQIYAHRHPDALTGVILESVCPCFRQRLADPTCLISPRHPNWQAPLAAAGLLAPDSHDQVGDPAATEWADVPGAGAVFRRRGGPALLVSPVPPEPEMRAAMPLLWTVDCRSLLPAIRTPALVLAGSADPVVPVAHVRAVADALVGASFVQVDGGGHVPSTEQRPEVSAALRVFVQRTCQMGTGPRGHSDRRDP